MVRPSPAKISAGFPAPQTPPALTHHLHLARYASLHGKEGIYLYFSIRKQGINWLRHQYIGAFLQH